MDARARSVVNDWLLSIGVDVGGQALLDDLGRIYAFEINYIRASLVDVASKLILDTKSLRFNEPGT